MRDGTASRNVVYRTTEHRLQGTDHPANINE